MASAGLDGSLGAAIGRAEAAPRTAEAARVLCALAQLGDVDMVRRPAEAGGIRLVG